MILIQSEQTGRGKGGEGRGGNSVLCWKALSKYPIGLRAGVDNCQIAVNKAAQVTIEAQFEMLFS